MKPTYSIDELLTLYQNCNTLEEFRKVESILHPIANKEKKRYALNDIKKVNAFIVTKFKQLTK